MAAEGEVGTGEDEEEEEADAETKIKLMTEWLERRQDARAAATAAAERSVVQPAPEVTRAITPTKRQDSTSLMRRLHAVSPTPQGNPSAMQRVLAELDATKSSTLPPAKPQALAELHAAYATSTPESPQKKARVEPHAAKAARPPMCKAVPQVTLPTRIRTETS